MRNHDQGRVLSGYTASVSDFRFSETRVRVEILQFIKKKHCTTLLSKNDLSLIFLRSAPYHEFFLSIPLGGRLVSRPISLIIEPSTTQWQRENGYWLLHCHSRLFVFSDSTYETLFAVAFRPFTFLCLRFCFFVDTLIS